MFGWERPSYLRYGTAVGAVLLIAGVRLLLNPWLGDLEPFLPFVPAVLAAVIWCGRGPAVVAALLSLAIGCLLLASTGTAAVDAVVIIVFVLSAAGMIALGDAAARARRQVRESDQHAALRSAEAAEAAEELRLLVASARGYALFMLDPDGRVTIWNEGAARLLGWAASEVVGRHWSLFFPHDAVMMGEPGAVLAQAEEAGQLEEEGWRLRKDGSEFISASVTTALRDGEGRLRGFCKIMSDITDRRAGEEHLRAREGLLRSILSGVPDAMVVFDEDAEIILFSHAAQALFGYTEAEAIGCDVRLLLPVTVAAADEASPALAGADRVAFGRRRDGTTFPAELAIGEASVGDERLFTAFVRDITARRATEERLQALQAELIQVTRVSAMGAMASTLAHELNQPIAAIANYVEAVRDQLQKPSPEEFSMMREALDDTAREALRAGDILRQLRDFVARGEVGKSVEPLPALIEEAAAAGLTGAGAQGIAVCFALAAEASPVLVDRVQVQHVVINLVRNACEAMSGSHERQLTIASAADEPGFVRVTVADTGPGIAPEVAAQLFTAFVSSKGEGMGLGLSICRTIVEANGGRIWMEPRAEGGTAFHFTLARAHSEQGA